MTDKVQKIREEVEKIARSINPYIPDEEGKNSEYEAGRFAMVTQIMQIIESMQEEPKLEGVEKEVAEAHIARINRKRIPIELKGEIKAKFKNEFHTLWQTVNGMQFANAAKCIIERICLHFAAWGAYYLKDYIGMSDEEKEKMDSLQEEPVSEELEETMQHNAPNNIGIDDLLYWRNGFVACFNWQKRKDSISSKDLEELIDALSKRYPEVSFAKLSRIAVKVAKWQKQKTLDKACNFLEMLGQGFTITGKIAHNTYNVEQLITDFKNYIKD